PEWVATVASAGLAFVRLRTSVQSFSEWPERERWEVSQADEDDDHADEQDGEQRAVRLQRAGRLWHRLLSGERAAECEHEDHRHEPGDQHHHASGEVVPTGGGGE